MFARASSKVGSRVFSSARTVPKSCRAQWVIASSAITGFSLYVISQRPVHNDAHTTGNTSSSSKQHPENVGLSPIVWGSNLNHLIASERDSNDCIKSPTYAPELFSSPLRDLAFSSSHAACVDASGNVYQWGDSFFGSEYPESKRPRLTLRGKNIVSLAITPSKIFALAASGKIYVLSSSLRRQLAPQSPRSVWNFFNWTAPQTLFAILDTDVPLGWGERFTSISAGSDHLLALTSLGRTFAHPVTRSANWHGQLGLRKIFVRDPVDSSKRLPLELLPKATRDNLHNEKMPSHDGYRSEIQPSDLVDDETAWFCSHLFEVPALRGVDVRQIAAGDRTSFTVTRRDGRVLGWGANEFGQLGMGANITLSSVSVPTEVVLSKFTERGTVNRCMSIAAGGDLTFFTVQKELPTGGASVVDVLACGNGQWGGLGNSSYSNAQGIPVKVKSISGGLEYDEKTNSLKPLKPHSISVAPGPVTNNAGMLSSSSGHVIATLDTIPLSHLSPNNSVATDAADSLGRDVLTWGLNRHYQLGNGKRASANTPVFLETGDREGRLVCKVRKGKVMDFTGDVVGRRMKIEQRAIAGPGLSVVYWRIVENDVMEYSG